VSHTNGHLASAEKNITGKRQKALKQPCMKVRSSEDPLLGGLQDFLKITSTLLAQTLNRTASCAVSAHSMEQNIIIPADMEDGFL